MQAIVVSSLVLFICGQIYADGSDMVFTSDGDKCLVELGFTEENLKDANLPRGFLVEGNADVNKFVGCVWKKINYLNENGEINTDELERGTKSNIRGMLGIDGYENEDEYVHTLVTSCLHINGTDAGDTAVKMSNCILATLKS